MESKIDLNILKVIKQLSLKKSDSRDYKKYKKILSKKFLNILHYKKTRTRDESLKYFYEFKNKDIVEIPKNLIKTIKGNKND